MITLPDDYNAIGYDLQTTDGNIWRFVRDGDTAALVCGDLRQPVMVLDGRMTLFAPGYRNINLHGFDLDGIHYTLTDTPRNANWTPAPDAPPEQAALVATKERAFAAALLYYAAKFQIDITTIPDINTTSLLLAAKTNGASQADTTEATANLLALCRDIEAEQGLNWADCWAALKSRLPGYIMEIMSQQQ